jgi:hypothetical protein
MGRPKKNQECLNNETTTGQVESNDIMVSSNFKETAQMANKWENAAKFLNAKELALWRIIKNKDGVLFLKGKPGTCKSAILRSIALKLGLNYIDFRLSQIDESDLGVFPCINEASRNTKAPTFQYAAPQWALDANAVPTLLNFEELNRASLQVRNAALQVLNERCVAGVKLNDNVFMASSGNLGEEDGCDIEEFDKALNGRLIHKNHNMTYQDWHDGYAKENVHGMVLSYLTAHPEEIYKTTESSPAYASHRTWTFLSSYMKGMGEVTNQELLTALQEDGSAFIGPSITKFIRFVEEQNIISINDVLNRYKEVEATVKAMPRARRSELLAALKSMNAKDLTVKHAENIVLFLNLLDDDEKVSYLVQIVDNDVSNDANANNNKAINTIIKPFTKQLQKLLDK